MTSSPVREPFDTLPALLWSRSAAQGTDLALREKFRGIWRSYTWDDVTARVQDLAAGLMADLPGEGRRIAIIGEDSAEALIAGFAVQSIGAAVAYLPPDSTAEEIAALVREGGISCAVAQDQEQCDKLLGDGCASIQRIYFLESHGLGEYTDIRLVSARVLEERGRSLLADDPDAVRQRVSTLKATTIASLVMTSGVVGPPRFVRASHGHLIDVAARLRAGLDIRPGATYLLSSPLSSPLGHYLAMALGPLLPLVMCVPEPGAVAQDRRQVAPQVLAYAPAEWRTIYEDVQQALRSVPGWTSRAYSWVSPDASDREPSRTASLAFRLFRRQIRRQLGFSRIALAVSSGAPMPRRVLEFFESIGVRLQDIYATAETGPLLVTSRRADGSTATRELVAATTRLRVSGDEIQVQANHPDTAFADPALSGLGASQWLRTGDCGVSEGTTIRVVDRLDRMHALLDGDLLPPSAIELSLRESRYVRFAVAFANPAGDGMAVLVGISPGVVSEWAETIGIADRSYASLVRDDRVIDLLAAEIQRLTASLPGEFRPTAFGVLHRPLARGERELTSDRRIRHRVVAEVHSHTLRPLTTEGISTVASENAGSMS